MRQPEITILAIDPGSRKLGWAVVRSRDQVLQRIASGVIRPQGELVVRLGQILTQVGKLLDDHVVAALAIESAFVHDNPRTALVLGQARGIPIALAAARGLPVHEYAPAHVKRALVGSGRADKHQMQQMVKAVLGLAELPGEDEADALAVAVTHLRQGAFAQYAVPATAALVVPELALTPARLIYLQAVQRAKAAGGAR